MKRIGRASSVGPCFGRASSRISSVASTTGIDNNLTAARGFASGCPYGFGNTKEASGATKPSNEEAKVKKVLIVGGGIGGLTLGIGLNRRGVQATIFEQAKDVREVGAGSSICPSGVKALRKVGVDVYPLDVGRDSELYGRPFPFTQHTGEITFYNTEFADMEQRYGARVVMVHRHALHTLLHKNLPSGAVRLDSKVVGVEQDANGATVILENGQKETGDVVIGADGIWSTVRTSLFGDPQTLLEYRAASWRGLCPKAKVSHPFVNESLGFLSSGPGSQFFCTHLGKDTIYWSFVTRKLPPSTARRTTVDTEYFQDYVRTKVQWHAPLHDLILNTDNIIRTDLYTLKKEKKGETTNPALPAWGRGRVALLGDACHPTTPELGMGANMALEDAVRLAEMLKGCESREVERVLRAYADSRRERCTKLVDTAAQIADMGMVENPVRRWIGKQTMRLMRKFMDPAKFTDWIYAYNP